MYCCLHVRRLLFAPFTAPQEQKPLFSAEYLADRELNRTGSTPSDLKAALSASERKKNKSEPRSRPGSVIKAHHPVDAKTVELQHNSGQHSQVELSRSSDPSEISTSETVVGRVIVDDRPAQQAVQAKQQGHDVEAGLALDRAGSGRGLALPFTPMSVAFKDISYFVPHPGVSFAFVFCIPSLEGLCDTICNTSVAVHCTLAADMLHRNSSSLCNSCTLLGNNHDICCELAVQHGV